MKILNIFDFDGTLFNSPIPNHSLWSARQYRKITGRIGMSGLGWYQNPITLTDVDNNQFNNSILDLVTESAENPNAVTILLTGREMGNREAISSIINTKQLQFDEIILKPCDDVFTFVFKTKVIDNLINKYGITKLNIYDDRISQIKKFKSYIAVKNRIGIISTMYPVSFPVSHFDKEREKRIVQELMDDKTARDSKYL